MVETSHTQDGNKRWIEPSSSAGSNPTAIRRSRRRLRATSGNEPHGHDFAVRGLVLEGAFTVLQGNQSVTYRPGQVFAVEGVAHSEEIGPEGACVLVGRKY